MAVALIVIACVVLVIVLFMLGTMFVMVRQQGSVVIERLGKFNRILGPGLHLKLPLLERTAGKLSLRIQQLEVPVETKTKDNVIVNVSIAVQFKVPANNVEKAFYQLDDPERRSSRTCWHRSAARCRRWSSTTCTRTRSRSRAPSRRSSRSRWRPSATRS